VFSVSKTFGCGGATLGHHRSGSIMFATILLRGRDRLRPVQLRLVSRNGCGRHSGRPSLFACARRGAIGSGWEEDLDGQWLYIVTMLNPWTISSKPVFAISRTTGGERRRTGPGGSCRRHRRSTDGEQTFPLQMCQSWERSRQWSTNCPGNGLFLHRPLGCRPDDRIGKTMRV
jgi:hypothetical protein